MCPLGITDVSVLFCYVVMYSNWKSGAHFLPLQTKKRASVPYWPSQILCYFVDPRLCSGLPIGIRH